MGSLCSKPTSDEKPVEIYYYIYDLQNDKYEYTKISWSEKISVKEYT